MYEQGLQPEPRTQAVLEESKPDVVICLLESDCRIRYNISAGKTDEEPGKGDRTMAELKEFTIYEGDGICLKGWFLGKKLRLNLDGVEPFFHGIASYELSEEDTKKLMSLIRCDDFAKLFSEGGQEWLEAFFDKNEMIPKITCFGNFDIAQRYSDDIAFCWTFDEFDSAFDGHDYEYTFSFDQENTEKLKEAVLSDGGYDDIAAWIKKEVSDQDSGYDFMEFCERHGIHGVRRVYEDYPGGVHYHILF